ncbi:MAG: MFS transporter [Rhodospirillales bacterium]|nr:MFS transporter [Rhodospirillales bacterium]
MRLSILVGAIFFVLGLTLPFWPVFLELHGMSAGDIGLLLAASTWVKILGVPFWGRMADRRQDTRTVLLLLALLSLSVYLWFGAVTGFLLFLIGHLLLGFVVNPLVPLSDSEILKAGRSRGLDYGRIRLWGSIAFIAGNLAGGALIEPDRGYWYLASLAAGMALTACAAASLPRAPRDRRPLPAGPWRVLLTDRPFLFLILIAGLLQASHAAYYALSALIWREAGLSDSTIAWLWAEGVLAEIAFLAFGSRVLACLGHRGLLLLAAAGGILRWSVMAVMTDLTALIAIQSLHALTFAAAHLGAVTLIVQIVPASAAASGQALAAALQGGVMMGLALFLAGELSEVSSAGAFFTMAGFSGIALVLTLCRWQGLSLQPRQIHRPAR